MSALDRKKAQDILMRYRRGDMWTDKAIRDLEACVVPDPPQTIDGHDLNHVLNLLWAKEITHAEAMRRIKALVRPSGGLR